MCYGWASGLVALGLGEPRPLIGVRTILLPCCLVGGIVILRSLCLVDFFCIYGVIIFVSGFTVVRFSEFYFDTFPGAAFTGAILSD